MITRLPLISALMLTLLASEAQSQDAGAFVLHDGTPVRLRLNRTMSSADAKVGESVDFEVLDDVKIGETVLIRRGSTAIGTVTDAVPKRRMARGGKLDVNIDYVRLVTDERVALRAVKDAKGEATPAP